MNKLNPSEKRFEDYIEKNLNTQGYTSYRYDNYDRKLCLIKEEVIDFIQKTQKKSWDKLKDIYQDETENKDVSN